MIKSRKRRILCVLLSGFSDRPVKTATLGSNLHATFLYYWHGNAKNHKLSVSLNMSHFHVPSYLTYCTLKFMRSTCGKSSAKPVTVVDEHVISDLFIQICLEFFCIARHRYSRCIRTAAGNRA